ncbi:hypothetical protein GCM10023169_40810 [Georgenia halophila]|uniref:Uncharacterized protein n=1 Tax=Georgenia halophila TaxID=620889 RepID=A0ABP8LRF4_9MICO
MGKQGSIRFATATFAAAASMTLAGCFANPAEDLVDEVSEDAAKQGAEELVEGVTDGQVDVEYGEMPENFPDEVPLVSTDVMQSTTVNDEQGSGIMVIVADAGKPSEVAQKIKADFSGWEEVVWTDMGELISAQYRMDEMVVTVGVTAGSEGGSAVSYGVYGG